MAIPEAAAIRLCARQVLRAAAFLLLLWTQAAVPQTAIFDAPRGFWLAPPRAPGILHSPSAPGANWRFAQWNNPDGEVTGFDSRGVARSESLVFTIVDGGYRIEQRGDKLPCKQEFDAFAAPNNGRVYSEYPSAMRGTKRLSEMGYLKHRIAVRPLNETILDRSCSPTQGVYMTALVFANEVSNQRLFYQLRLRAAGIKPRPNWWARGGKGRYGFGDVLATFGLEDARMGEEARYEIDLLPRIRELIRGGAYGIDTDLANWRISSAYHGQAMWGNVVMTSEWTGFALHSD